MNLIKQIICLVLVLFFTKNVTTRTTLPQKDISQVPSPKEIEEIMRSDEFKQMMGELDEIFADMDEDDLKPVKKEPAPKPSPITKPTQDAKIKPAAITKKSMQEEFLDPIKQSKDEKFAKDKLVTKLPSKKIEAFFYYTNRLVKALNNIELKINSFKLGPAFKEQMQELGLFKLFNNVEIRLSNIKSKKLYLKVFYLPMFTQLRQNILNTLKIVEKTELDLVNIKLQNIKEESEKSDFEFLQKIAKKKPTKKSRLDLNLTPLQKEIKDLLKSDLKKIEAQLNSIIKSAQAKEEIEAKKKAREQAEAAAAKEKPIGRRYPPRYRPGYPPYRPGPGYGSGDYQRRRPGPSPYPRTGQPSQPKPDSSTISPPKTQEPISTDRADSARPIDEKTAEKIAKLNNLGQEVIKLTEEIKTKYKIGNNNNLEDVYNSKLLSKLNSKLEELDKVRISVQAKETDIKQPAKKASIPKVDNALKDLIGIFIPLAKNPGDPQETVAAANILRSLGSSSYSTELAKYENQIITKLEGAEHDLGTASESPENFANIYRNLKILESNPKSGHKKIKNIKTKYRNKIEDLGEIEEVSTDISKNINAIQDIRASIGQTNVTVRSIEDQNLNIKANILATINNSGQPAKIRELLVNATNKILTGGNDQVPNDEQTKKLKAEYLKVVRNYEKQKKYLVDIEGLVRESEEVY